MPVFDYQCVSCNEITKDVFVHRHNDPVACSSCSGETIKLPPNRVTVHTWPAEGVHLKHVEPGGRTFHSKTEMKRYARDNDLELSALL